MQINVDEHYTLADLLIDGSYFSTISWPNSNEDVPDTIAKNQLFIDSYDHAFALKDCWLLVKAIRVY